MLTPKELKLLKINPEVAREAYVQTEKRLIDHLEAKKSAETKASALLTSYITIALALFGLGGAFLKEASLANRSWPFFIAGLVFVAGAGLFLAALRDEEYGFLGSSPDMWLRPTVIDGGANALPAMLAYMVYFHQERIEASIASNQMKLRLLKWGMAVGIAGALTLAAMFLIMS